MSTAKKISFLLFALAVIALIKLGLGPVTLAGMFSYLILDLTHRKLSLAMRPFVARWLSVGIFLVVATIISLLLWHFIKLAIFRLPLILLTLVPKIDALANTYGVDLPFENLQELRQLTLDAIKDNARSVTRLSGLLTKEFFSIIIGIISANLCFLTPAYEKRGSNLYESVRVEFCARIKIFMRGFEEIFAAQAIICLINTALTMIFLVAAGIPYLRFLTLATLVFGFIPIIGNIISNAIIVATVVPHSLRLAAVALAYLIVIHKGEYLLNGKILGDRIKTPAWQILMGILVGEALLGLPGVILAPAMIHYAREELRLLPVS